MVEKGSPSDAGVSEARVRTASRKDTSFRNTCVASSVAGPSEARIQFAVSRSFGSKNKIRYVASSVAGASEADNHARIILLLLLLLAVNFIDPFFPPASCAALASELA